MRKDLLKIIEHYGVMKQLKYFQSEVFELNEAIIEHETAKGIYQNAVEITRFKKEHIVEEIADCLVMIHQFIEYYKIDNNDVSNIMNQKIDRQLDRIRNEKENKKMLEQIIRS